jgi:hypothetical protein
MGVPDASIAAFVGGAEVGSAVSDGSGSFDLAIATGGVAPNVVVTLAAVGYFTTREYSDLASDRSITTAHLQIINGGAMSSVYSAGNESQGSDTGSLGLLALDCSGDPIAGVTFAVTPAPEIVQYDGSDGYPFVGGPTTLPYGGGIAYNAVAATTRVDVSRDGVYPFSVDGIEVSMGDALSVLTVHLP